MEKYYQDMLLPNLTFYILAFEYGQYRTIKKWDCIDKSGNPIPWYTYSAIEYLSNLDFSNKNIFEYGAGNSTLWWAKVARNAVSVEHDLSWFNKINSIIQDMASNTKLMLEQDKSRYIESILYQNIIFDVIIIDGVYRSECARIIENKLNLNSPEGCLVILDNSDWYPKTAKYLREELNFIEIDFHGFGPINNYTWTTSLFLSRNFNFRPINDEQPSFSISAIHQGGG